jgi:acylphosphatase
MKANRLLIDGVVQGVGFRFFAARAARDLGVRGFVRNLPDGRVEVLAAGTTETMGEFTARLRRGPRGSRVESIECEDAEMDEAFAGFEIRHGSDPAPRRG